MRAARLVSQVRQQAEHQSVRGANMKSWGLEAIKTRVSSTASPRRPTIPQAQTANRVAADGAVEVVPHLEIFSTFCCKGSTSAALSFLFRSFFTFIASFGSSNRVSTLASSGQLQLWIISYHIEESTSTGGIALPYRVQISTSRVIKMAVFSRQVRQLEFSNSAAEACSPVRPPGGLGVH
ncbi:hypothetical protein BJY01DRAFT_31275 [Aspergillus pseudoustus]|uniref:Uncharacterized protein n=1 Tax=Aspergillus pseudoustus TaxID=1810923 RepID=A0ABR4KR26_9EURO